MKVIVDQNTCIGCSVCTDVADKFFEMKDGKSHAIEGADLSSAEDQESARQAVEICPVRAISIEE